MTTSLDKDGYCGPFAVADISRIDALWSKAHEPGFKTKDRHVDIPAISNFIQDSSLHKKVSEFAGFDWDLWRTNFFYKKSGASAIGWHHDKHFQSGNQPLDFTEIGTHLSFVTALHDMTLSNGALEVIPGSHLAMVGLTRDARPFHARTLQEHFVELPAHVLARKRQIEIRRGEFLLFHSALIHGSQPFISGNSRVSMVGRLVKRNVELPGYLQDSLAVIPFN